MLNVNDEETKTLILIFKKETNQNETRFFQLYAVKKLTIEIKNEGKMIMKGTENGEQITYEKFIK